MKDSASATRATRRDFVAAMGAGLTVTVLGCGSTQEAKTEDESMPAKEYPPSIARLAKLAPPPEKPLWPASDEPQEKRLQRLPTDYVALLRTYGSGDFQYKDAPCLEVEGPEWHCFSSDFIVLYNPCEPHYTELVAYHLDLIREFNKEGMFTGGPYDIHPASPGLFPWARGAGRNYFFWHTVGEPDAWPVVTLGDLEDFVEYRMGMTEFLTRLFLGELDISTLLAPGHLVPGVARFESRKNRAPPTQRNPA